MLSVVVVTLIALCAAVGAAPVRDSLPSPLDLSQFAKQRVMLIVAHPDDVEGLAGGLVWQLTQQGTQVYYLIATNGDKGGLCYNGTNTAAFYPCPKEDLASLRRNEALDAAEFLGVPASHVRFLDLEDSRLSTYPASSVRLKMVAFMRKVQPFAVFTFAPELNLHAPPMRASLPYGWDDLGYHPDHQTSGALVRDAVLGFEVSDALMMDELADAGLAPWSVTQLYFFSLTAPEMTHYLDIGGVPLRQKLAAFLLHRSQTEGDVGYLNKSVTWVAEQVARNAGSETTAYAEGFTAYF